jgi:tRNA (guanine37-N1)-methyltransferase
MSLEIGIITLFADAFAALSHGVIGRAIENNLIKIKFYNPRDFSTNQHGNVDDKPYGGGAGMVMQVQPLRAAINAARAEIGTDTMIIYLSPQGTPVTQNLLQKYNDQFKKFIFICGRYEGVDQRIIEHDIDQEWCVGDFIVSGGELPTMMVLDALGRLQEGVLGHNDSNKFDSFSNGLLEHPHYTRPEEIDGQKVPNVLLSGNHKEINEFRAKQALINTWHKRPELLKSATLDRMQREWLKDLTED